MNGKGRFSMPFFDALAEYLGWTVAALLPFDELQTTAGALVGAVRRRNAGGKPGEFDASQEGENARPNVLKPNTLDKRR